MKKLQLIKGMIHYDNPTPIKHFRRATGDEWAYITESLNGKNREEFKDWINTLHQTGDVVATAIAIYLGATIELLAIDEKEEG